MASLNLCCFWNTTDSVADCVGGSVRIIPSNHRQLNDQVD